MTNKAIGYRARVFGQAIVGILLAMTLAACGGGGGSAGGSGAVTPGGGTPAGSGTMTIALQDTNTGAISNTVGSGPLTALATVKTTAGLPAANVLVTFTLSSTIAALSPVTGTALTDTAGVAKVNIQSTNTGSGAAEVMATATVGTTAVTAKAAFSVTASPSAVAAAINFVSAAPADKSIVIKGAGGNGRTEVALVTFKVVDNTNAGVVGKLINFTVQSAKPVTLATQSATTGQDGTVSVALNSGTEPTTVTIIATVAGTQISTKSDTVTVTTGQPVQAAFSLSVEKFYVEGLNVDNQLNKILILIADKFGGAVADGTQVVFTTDSGAIVGTGGAACLTVGGQCTVTWRSQLPRDTNGVVTVVASSTNSNQNLSASIKFYYSGSFGTVYRVKPDHSGRLSNGGAINLDFSSSCEAQTIEIEVADANNNPMPQGTTINGVGGVNASATVSPSTVAYNGAAIVAGAGGTFHSLTVTPNGCDLVAGTKTVTGQIDVSVKAAFGEQLTRINLGLFKAK